MPTLVFSSFVPDLERPSSSESKSTSSTSFECFSSVFFNPTGLRTFRPRPGALTQSVKDGIEDPGALWPLGVPKLEVRMWEADGMGIW